MSEVLYNVVERKIFWELMEDVEGFGDSCSVMLMFCMCKTGCFQMKEGRDYRVGCLSNLLCFTHVKHKGGNTVLYPKNVLHVENMMWLQ